MAQYLNGPIDKKQNFEEVWKKTADTIMNIKNFDKWLEENRKMMS